jgi:hypothetical protein
MKPPSERSLGPAGWAVYLGCSWTWCIGMFLPALLIRDLGFWGYVVFAVPNVVGAAAMGWVLRSPESSRKLVEDHRAAAVMFSRVTILFHVFWISWVGWIGAAMLSMNGITNSVILAVLGSLTALAYAGAAVLNKSTDRRKHLASFLVWTVSAGLLLLVTLGPSVFRSDLGTLLKSKPFTMDVVWLLPASIFGFVFCPYLDLTFNRARQACNKPSESRFAFGMGFGVFFCSMILLTLIYGTHLLNDFSSIAGWAAAYLILHIVAQLVVSVVFHSDELERTAPRSKSSLPVSGFAVLAAVIAAFGLLCNTTLEDVNAFGLTTGEFTYRLFLTFYALIFPTYVYLNVWDVRRRTLRRRTTQSMRVTLIAILLAAPFFFMGFIVLDEIFIVPGIAFLLLAKLFTGPDDKPEPIAQPA